MKKHWWKILCVGLLLYSFIAGLTVPLNPGIIRIDKTSANTGETITLKVSTYNSTFEKDEKGIRSWLRLGKDYAITALSVEASKGNELFVHFAIPEFLPIEAKTKEVSLIVDYKMDGAYVLPSALFIKQTNTNIPKGKALWSFDKIGALSQHQDKTFPYRSLLKETIRNLFYHVPLWFAMIIIFLVSAIYSGKYLKSSHTINDHKAAAFTRVGILYGFLGLTTGAIWANYTWGQPWSWDVKQNMSAIAMLIYLAYFVLRSSFDDDEKRARISAVYNIFAFAALIPLLFVIPRMTDSLHPGNGGNPGFGGEDLDNTMRMIFYPAIIGFTLLAVWIANLLYRIEILIEKKYMN